MDKLKYLETFIKSAFLPDQTVLLCIAHVNTGANITRIFENTPDGHAEKKFCDDTELRNQLKENGRQIQLYITTTPCSEPDHICADKLIAFAKAVSPVEVIIKCVHLYYLVGGKREQPSVDGLVRLKREPNVTLDVIMEDDWRYLRDYLGVNNADFYQMMNKDQEKNLEVFGGLAFNTREHRQQQLLDAITENRLQ